MIHVSNVSLAYRRNLIVHKQTNIFEDESPDYEFNGSQYINVFIGNNDIFPKTILKRGGVL